MIRKLSLFILILLCAETALGATSRRRSTGQKPFPACTMITGTAAVTFTRDDGATLTPSAETLTGVGYTYGVVALPDDASTLMAWHKSDLLLSTDAGCSWRVVGTFDDWDFPPKLVAGTEGRVYAWSDNRSYLIRYDSRGAVRLKPPVPFAGFGVLRDSSDIIRGGGDDGSIWQSTDAGNSWEQIGSLRPQRSPAIFYRFSFDPADLDHIIAGTTLDGAYYSWDGGRIWRQSTGLGSATVNVFEAVISPVDEAVVWVMGLDMGNGDGRHIYRSTDGGATFHAVVDDTAEVNLVNGPTMAAHPTDSSVLYFVFGTKFQGYGTDLFRYDAASNRLSMTHNANHDINAIAFSPADARVMYLGLEVENGTR